MLHPRGFWNGVLPILAHVVHYPLQIRIEIYVLGVAENLKVIGHLPAMRSCAKTKVAAIALAATPH
jgi:hypothetical protein